MFETHWRIAPRRAVALLASMLVAGGAFAHTPDVVATQADEIQVLVQFDGRGCPTAVVHVIDSCSGMVLPATAIPADPGPVGQICRAKGKKVTWLAVTGSPPALGQNRFYVRFADNSPVETQCKKSHNGALKCKVKAEGPQGFYKYSITSDVTSTVESCLLDPRFYVN